MNNNSYSSGNFAEKAEWLEVHGQAVEVWDRKLASTACPYRQFPFWIRAHEEHGSKARFFYYGDKDSPIAVVAILEVGKFPFRSALIDRGPFLFDVNSSAIEECLSSLIDLTKKLGYVFVRFTSGQEAAFSLLKKADSVRSLEPYPFSRDPRNFLIVEQKPTEKETLATFNETARRKIRKAVSVGYEIGISNSEEDFYRAWDLFEELALRKGFKLTSKPKSVWRKIVELGSVNERVRLYLCTYEGKLVAAQIVVNGGEIAEGTLSALDVEALEGKPSPAALLTWIAMRDAQQLGCKYFDMGGPGDPKRNNYVFEFKRMFRPVGHAAPDPLCLVVSPMRFSIWMRVLKIWSIVRKKAVKFGKKNPNPVNKVEETAVTTGIGRPANRNAEV